VKTWKVKVYVWTYIHANFFTILGVDYISSNEVKITKVSKFTSIHNLIGQCLIIFYNFHTHFYNFHLLSKSTIDPLIAMRAFGSSRKLAWLFVCVTVSQCKPSVKRPLDDQYYYTIFDITQYLIQYSLAKIKIGE